MNASALVKKYIKEHEKGYDSLVCVLYNNKDAANLSMFARLYCCN